MGKNFDSPFIPSEVDSRFGVPFFSNSFMSTRPFLGEPSGALLSGSGSRSAQEAEGDLSIEARFEPSQVNWLHIALMRR